MHKMSLTMAFLFLLFSAQLTIADGSGPGEQIKKDSRCPVCGMFVAKYPQWLTQLTMSDGSIESFDGVKDMMAYYFSPQQYGAAETVTVTAVSVRDYYSQDWSDGLEATYVIGSDVYGPMGHELVPFSSREGAENFLKDHHGRQLFSFSEITQEIVESLRKGHKM
jgi:copper chaperone NosL